MQSIILSGHAGSDPEFKTVGANDTELATVSLAVSRYRGRGKEDATDWYRLQFWGSKCRAAEHIGKGDKIAVIGEPQINVWEGEDGNKRSDIQVNVRQVEFMGGRTGATVGGFDDKEDDATGGDSDLPF